MPTRAACRSSSKVRSAQNPAQTIHFFQQRWMENVLICDSWPRATDLVSPSSGHQAVVIWGRQVRSYLALGHRLVAPGQCRMCKCSLVLLAIHASIPVVFTRGHQRAQDILTRPDIGMICLDTCTKVCWLPLPEVSAHACLQLLQSGTIVGAWSKITTVTTPWSHHMSPSEERMSDRPLDQSSQITYIGPTTTPRRTAL
jgi:hypothetical protein